MESELTCPGCGGALGDSCADCGGLWMSFETLCSNIRAKLNAQGHEARMLSLHEAPAGEGELDCPECRARMARVRLRGLIVERCRLCDGMFLEPGLVNMICRRILAAAQTARGKRPMPVTRSGRLGALPDNRSRYRTSD